MNIKELVHRESVLKTTIKTLGIIILGRIDISFLSSLDFFLLTFLMGEFDLVCGLLVHARLTDWPWELYFALDCGH